MNNARSSRNRTIFQAFEWHLPSGAGYSYYPRLTRLVPTLSALGITSIWLPPGCKANNPHGNGYDIYDLWDLGEFEQKGTRSTKWGSKEELDELIGKTKECGVEIIWDAVLNHKTAGDRTEEAWAVEVDEEDRRYEKAVPRKIEAWVPFDFPGREREGMKYSKMKWRAEHFNGTDWDQRKEQIAIFKLIDDPATLPRPFIQPQQIRASAPSPRSPRSRFATWRRKISIIGDDMKDPDPPARRPGKGWAFDVDAERGNNDYLMFSNIDYTHPEVRRDTLNWAEWMIKAVGTDGFRLDAVQHFSYNFVRDWIQHANKASREKNGKDVFVVGEIWTGEVSRIFKWLDVVQQASGPQVYAYDAPLLYNFSRISEDIRQRSRNTDLRTLTRDSLLQHRSEAAVTVVANHDTQPGQAMEVAMIPQLKLLFYAFILLRKEGLPCVFWGDLFGTKGPHSEPPIGIAKDASGREESLLAKLMMCRKHFAYGEQTDYWSDAFCLGWTRGGTRERPGCAALISVAPPTKTNAVRKMQIGEAGTVWTDALGRADDEVKIDANGACAFPYNGPGVSVFVRKSLQHLIGLPEGLDTSIYQTW